MPSMHPAKLIIAVRDQDVATVYNFLKEGFFGVEVDYTYEILNTSLSVAHIEGNNKVTTLLLEFCAKREMFAWILENSHQDLHMECIKILLKYKNRVPFGLFYEYASRYNPYYKDGNPVDEEALVLLYKHVSLTDRTVYNDGLTALHIAIQTRNLEGVEILLERGANVNDERTFNGNGALHLAIEMNPRSVEIIKKLLEYGAQSDLTNSKGLTPLHYLDFYLRKDPMYGREEIRRALKFGRNTTDQYLKSSNKRYNEGLCLCDILIEQITRFQYTGKHISEKQIELIETSGILSDHYQKCREELKRIEIEIVSENVILCEFLEYSKRLILRVRNTKVVEAFRKQQYERRFPIFFKTLNRNLEAALNESILMDRAAVELSSMIKPLTPYSNVIETILGFLNVDDLNKLAEV